MPTLAAALAAAPSARLVRASVTVVISQDLDGECAVAVQASAAPPTSPQRCASLAEVLAYLASGAVTGVRGDEQDWEPI